MPATKRLATVGEPPVVPVYAHATPDASIPLGKLDVVYKDDSGAQAEEATAEAVLRLAPRERLEFSFPIATANRVRGVMASLGADATLLLVGRGVEFEVHCINWTGSPLSAKVTVAPKQGPVRVTEPTKKIVRAVGHVLSFPQFFGTSDCWLEKVAEDGSGTSGQRLGKVELNFGAWSSVLVEVGRSQEERELAKASGGLQVSHVISVCQTEERPFDSASLERYLDDLRLFLSFAAGRWIGIALPVGTGESGARVFERWGLHVVSRNFRRGMQSWFDDNHGHVLSDLFPGFMKRIHSTDATDPLRAALYWYLAANDRAPGLGPDAGLILAQTALENLAWTVCVLERRMVSKRAFGQQGLSAADRIRLLGSALEIPLNIPQELGGLANKPGEPWEDGAHAITEIRNALVHPSKKKRAGTDRYGDALLYSLWLLDLVFLRLFEYEGEYSNRTTPPWKRIVERVPWAAE